METNRLNYHRKGKKKRGNHNTIFIPKGKQGEAIEGKGRAGKLYVLY